MKAPQFDYVRVSTVADAVAQLRRHGDDARLLAGGQSLLATLNMRLSQPTMLVDITRIKALHGIAVHDGYLRIGALVRHVEIERSATVAQHLPLLTQAAPYIAHAAIRNRGTLGGSLALADPAAEWPACTLATDGELILSDGSKERRVMAGDFFIDLYQTDLHPDELVTAVEFPLPGPQRRFVFTELARRHGDYAIAGIAIAADVVGDVLGDLRIVFLGVGNTPMRALGAEMALNQTRGEAAALKEAVGSLKEDTAPGNDLYTSAEAKLHLAGVLLQRAVSSILHRGEQS
ncbi:MAG: xanthine dehydrogenase family protein subunit M [Rhodocyclaceae bacterium]|nr:MAG: xanthine dehydrogenase family protein subunit M [Rhodocyclaceae bacterium]